jgi:hypothetical protein
MRQKKYLRYWKRSVKIMDRGLLGKELKDKRESLSNLILIQKTALRKSLDEFIKKKYELEDQVFSLEIEALNYQALDLQTARNNLTLGYEKLKQGRA